MPFAHVYVPSGHKTLALWTGAKALPERVEFVMHLDDDTVVPRDMVYDAAHFADGGVTSAVSYGITMFRAGWVERLVDFEFTLWSHWRYFRSVSSTAWSSRHGTRLSALRVKPALFQAEMLMKSAQLHGEARVPADALAELLPAAAGDEALAAAGPAHDAVAVLRAHGPTYETAERAQNPGARCIELLSMIQKR